MIVYHGSKVEVREPDVAHSRKRVDFGPGFYVTPLRNQAVSLCGRFLRMSEPAVLSRYILDDQVFERGDIHLLRFETYSEEWLDFIVSCRNGEDASDYDLVMGGVANDKVFNTIELYLQRLIQKEDALGRLIYEKPNVQICIRNQQIMDQYLHFEGSEKL